VYQGVAQYTSTLTTTTNQWNHIVFSRSGSTQYFGLNGVVQSQAGTSTAPAASAFTIGCSYYSSTARYYFPGYISNFRYTPSTISSYLANYTPPTAPPTPTQATSLLLLGTNTGIQDATGKNDLITYGSVITQANTVKFGTGAMYFNGSSACVIPYTPILNFGAGNFTIEYWIYVTATPTGEQYVASVGTGNATGWRIAANNGSAAGVYFYFSGITETLLGSFPSSNAWHHVAIVRNGATITGYVDGTALSTTINAGTTSVPNMSTTDYSFIGGLYSSGSTPRLMFTGYLDDFRITKGVARYTANFTAPSVALLTQ
jgi:hypothetical protein